MFVSIILIFIDSKMQLRSYTYFYLENILHPLLLLNDKIKKNFDELFINFFDKKTLILKNKKLHQKILVNKINLLKIYYIKKENIELRKILNAPLMQDEKKILTKALSIGKNFYKDQIIINKGNLSGVYKGQILANDKGIIGQVISTNKLTSKVMLVCNINHALPVQTTKNNIRIVLIGNGCDKEMELDYILNIKKINIGDFLITSGLGGRFPKGYPVGIISTIRFDDSKDKTVIKVHSFINFKKLNYLVLLNMNNKNN